MQASLMDKLTRKYPGILQNVYCETGNGWNSHISTLCSDLDTIRKLTGVSTMATQVKEKYAGLRFYNTQDFSKRIPGTKSTAVMRIIDAVVAQYEQQAEHICDVCGESASTVKYKGWLYPLCTLHSVQMILGILVDQPECLHPEDCTPAIKNKLRKKRLMWPRRWNIVSVGQWVEQLAATSEYLVKLPAVVDEVFYDMHDRNSEDYAVIAVLMVQKCMDLNDDCLRALNVPQSIIDEMRWLKGSLSALKSSHEGTREQQLNIDRRLVGLFKAKLRALGRRIRKSSGAQKSDEDNT